MVFVRALAMFAVALCFMLAVNAAAVDGQREEGALGRRMLGNSGRALLGGSEFGCDAGFVAKDGVCVPESSATPAAPGGTPGCGTQGQPVCSGEQMRQRLYECDYGFTGMGSMCVPYKEKEQAGTQPTSTAMAMPSGGDGGDSSAGSAESDGPQVPTPLLTPVPTSTLTSTAVPAPVPVPAPAPVPVPTPAPVPVPTPTATPGVVSPACAGVQGVEQAWCESAPDECAQRLCNNVGMQSGGCGDPTVQAMIAADNSARAAAGAPALTCDDAICSVALEQSKSMCQRRSMDHEGLFKELAPNGRGARILDMGFKQLSENTFVNQNPLDLQVVDAHRRLMDSTYHRENLLDPQKSAVGYAYYVCDTDPTQQQIPNTIPLEFVSLSHNNLPTMYHTTTFGGTEQPTR